MRRGGKQRGGVRAPPHHQHVANRRNFDMKQSIADVLKPLAKVTHALTGKYLSHKAHADASKLADAIALAKGRAVLVKPTAAQASALCKVPLPVLQHALTVRGLRKPRVPKAPSAPPAGWAARVDAIVSEAGSADAVVDYLALREVPHIVASNGAGNVGNGADADAGHSA
jgi:hypothetical protein